MGCITDMKTPSKHRIIVIGANGELGHQIAQALLKRRVEFVAVVRAHTSAEKLASLTWAGISPVQVDFRDDKALRAVCQDASCVVSALNGLESVVLALQKSVLKAAIQASVPRFIPSDFSLDFTKTRPGDNRNLDLRRAFMRHIDAAPIKACSVLNGAFTDLLTGQAPIVLHRWRRILHWGAANQAMDFTAKQDVADFTAEVALDDAAPRFSRIAGDVVSPRALATVMSHITGRPYKTLHAGGIAVLTGMLTIAKAVTPETDAPFPAWQGMQYLRDMQSGRGKLTNLDNDRYGPKKWVSAEDVLAAHAKEPHRAK